MLNAKGLFSLSLFALSTICHANEELYIGIGAGPETAIFKQNSVVTEPGNFAVVNKTILGGRGFFGSIFAGYAFNLCACSQNLSALYLALEANANLSSVQFKSFNLELDHSNYNNATYKLRDSYGLSLLPGFFLNEGLLVYGRLSYGFGNFYLNTTENVVPNVNAYFPFLRYGLGVRQCFCDNFSIRLEYSWATYKKTNLLGFDPDSSTTKYTVTAPKSNRFEIGLSYYFL